MDRQIKYLKSLNLPDDIEFIIVDDGSEPPLKVTDYDLKNFSIYYTNNKLAWTQGLGRNLGASKAKGQYLLMTDIDHIITKEAFMDVYKFGGPMMRFPRYFGILDEDGSLKTDGGSLREYGIKPGYLEAPEYRTNVHRNTFAMRRDIYNEIGGYDPKWCTYGYHPKTRKGDDCYLDGAWRRLAREQGYEQRMGSKVYVFPNGRFHKDREKNPFSLFHDLSHKTTRFNKGETP